jgi:phosphoribosyl 1,2-cyclic phosphodiesterase
MINIKVLASSSSGNCYHIDDGETSLLLEAGIPIKKIQKATGYTVTKVSGCLVTHEHKDHSKAVSDLMHIGINCYMSSGTASGIEANGNRCKIIKAGEIFIIGSWKIKAFDTKHDCAEPLGYFMLSQNTGERLVFITDTYYVRYRFEKMNYIMVECNYADDIIRKNVTDGIIADSMRKRILRSHLSLDNCKELLRANDLSKVKEIYLLHLSDNNSDEIRFKKEIESLTGIPTYIAAK